MTTGENWFGRLYAGGYRELLLTAYALLEDVAEAEVVTREAFAVAYGRRIRLAQEESPLAPVRADLVRRARLRQRLRALPHRPPEIDRAAEAVRLHRLAGLSPVAIASIVDLPVAAVVAAVDGAGPVSWASVRQPVVDRVLVRSAQRRTRKRMLAVAAIAVVVLAAVVPLLRVQDTPAPAAAPPSTSWTPPPPDSSRRFVYDVKFADDYHAFALRATCESADCDLELLASDDGRRWSSHPVRKPAQPDSMMGQLIVLGPLDVAVDWYPVSPPSDENYRVHSTDGGQTWRSVSTDPRRTVSQIPEGASLMPACVDGRKRCTQVEAVVVLPGTGESARLTSLPRLLQAYPGPVPLDGNRWWISGILPGTLQWAIVVSGDDGRSWTVSPMVPSRKNVSDGWSVVGFGNDLYACDMGEVTGGDYAMLAVFHSGDGGRSWRRTSRWAPLHTMGTLVAAADGTLMTDTLGGGTLISRDHGRTFTKTATPRYTGYVYWAGAGYVSTPESEKSIMFSRDGVTWQPLNLEE